MMRSSLRRLKKQTKNESITESDMEEFDDLLSTDDEVEADSGLGTAIGNENLSGSTSQSPQVAEPLNRQIAEQLNTEEYPEQLNSMQNDVSECFNISPANAGPPSDSNNGFGPHVNTELCDQLNFGQNDESDFL